MRRIFNIILAVVLLLSLTACGGHFAQIDLKEPIAITEEGIVEKSVLDKVKADNAIATFTGVSNDIKYDWTIFGSDITETKDINLSLTLDETDKGIDITFGGKEDMGFPALLSIHLNEKWTSDSATAYKDDKAVYSVSITGSKTSILDISVDKSIEKCTILPDNIIEESVVAKKQEVVSVDQSQNRKPQADQQGPLISNKRDDYLSAVKQEDDRIYSDGGSTQKDKYQTDPIPEGKPLPVEPENQEINNQKAYTCTFSIECSTILNNLKDLDSDKLELIPSDGVILAPITVTFYEGESVFNVLQRVCKENGIHLESSWTPIYNSAYIEGIHNLYEFDCGELSGWVYRVNGWYPNYGCSRYQLSDGEVVEWRYTCDLGNDVGREGNW